ncbi:MAG: aspartate/glutamate racemase family protein [Cohaesibacteraceae bacterium]|nr:aspartate/glutamate racemase family protein [Cohaesibacteraceae bacterium]
MSDEKIVGIIGGMGPAAAVEFQQRIIDATPAENDGDHIHTIVDNNSKIPSRLEALIDGTGINPGPCIAQMAKRLETAGADFLVIPCNTAHHYYDYLVDAVSIPVSNMIELTIDHIRQKQPDITTIGLLASSAVQQIGLYEKYCAKVGLDVLFPENQDEVMSVILAIKAGQLNDQLTIQFTSAIENLKNRGAGCAVLACTELSIIDNSGKAPLPVYDTLDVLAQHVVSNVKGT